MRTHVALLRGINVGGHNKVAMADLRKVVTGLGHQDVTTYIQSGNVVFGSEPADATVLASTLEEELAERLGIRSSVVVLSRRELSQVVADNPYPQETNPKCLHAVFHPAQITPEALAALAAAEGLARDPGSRDEAAVVGRVLFLHTPDGLGRSELAARLARPASAKRPETGGTARNWATVSKLMELLDD